MTLVQAEREKKPRTSRFFRPRRLALAGFAIFVTILAAVAACSYFGFGFSRDKFKDALTALDRGDWTQTRRYARELRASQRSLPQAAFLQGAMLLEKGHCYPALDELEKARKDPSLETAALTLMGEAWYRLGRHVEAQAALEEALKVEPDSVEAHRWLAASYYDQGVIPQAEFHLKRTAELDPADPRPDRLLGLMHKDFERYEEAIPFYVTALRRNGRQLDAQEVREELASCQVKIRRYAEALATLEVCSATPAVEVLRANCHYAQGRIATAKAALGRALSQQPDHLDGLTLQGTMFLEEGETRAAVDSLKRASLAHPKDYTAHFKLAQAYGEAGQEQLASAELETAKKIAAIKVEFSELHKTVWQRPGDIQVRLRLAALAQELDRPDLAEVWLRSAAALQRFPASDAKQGR